LAYQNSLNPRPLLTRPTGTSPLRHHDNHSGGPGTPKYAGVERGAGVGRDPAAESDFRDFVAVRSAALHRTAYLLVGDWALAEDLVQIALTKTYLAWRRQERIDAVESYVRRVLVNAATSWWRRRWRG